MQIKKWFLDECEHSPCAVSTVETSVFGAESMKQGIDDLKGLRCKLIMIGILTSGPSYIYGYNILFLHNASKQMSKLKTKSNSVCYHAVHESVTIDESLVVHVPSRENIADLYL